MKQSNLYKLICELKAEKNRKLKIICDWDEVLKSREATVYHIVSNQPCSFTEFFRKFWENTSVEYQGHTCRIINTNLREVEQFREENSKEFQKEVEKIARADANLYDISPWLSIAEDLLKALKEDLIDYFVIAGNYKKNRHNEPNIDETLGGDTRKIKKFLKSFANFSGAKFIVNVPVYDDNQEKIKLSRPEWIKNNYPDFDLFIDDNPNNILGTREIFSSDFDKVYILPDYKTNQIAQGKNIVRVPIKPTLLKDEDFFLLFLDWTNIHSNFTPELQSQWQNLNFTYPQVQEWVNIHSPNDQSQEIQYPEFYAWLRDHKNLTAEQVLNDNTINFEALKSEFEQSQQQAQIIHNLPRNF